jgi:adenosylcobinamide kinase / adenosylcobinamide-phosphate guanylyltransferase
MGEVVLILGGARSGKTRLAERTALEQGPVVYVATATFDPSDPEMAARIERHRSGRPEGWTTEEIPRDLEARLPTLAGSGGSVVIDCVTLWLTNLMLGLGGGLALDDQAILETVERTVRVSRGNSRMIWVSNEVGSGVVPDNPLARRFADLQGWANQKLAEAADTVLFCVAGLPLRLK